MTTVSGLLQWGRKSQSIRYRNRFECYPQFYAICVTSGRLRLERRQCAALDLHPGGAVVLAPGAAFTLSTPDSAYGGHFVEWPPNVCSLPARAVVLPAERPLRAVIAMIEGEYAADADAEALPLLYHLLARRLLQATDRLGDDRSAPGVGPAAMLHARLRANLQADAGMTEILGNASAQRQARRILLAAGLPPPKRLLLEMRLDEARRLLRATTMPVTTVAFELGFPSSQHFATCYRKRFGHAPSGERA